MARLGKAIIGAGLETLYFSGGHRLARPFFSGLGALLTLHRIRPPSPDPFQPNRSLEITPAFLEEVVTGLRARGIALVSLDEACRRLASHTPSGWFAALTVDDGYRDFAEHAWPVFKRHEVPVALFVPSSFAEGTGALWWVELELGIARSDTVAVDMNGGRRVFDTRSDAAREEAFRSIYWWLRSLPDESEIRRVCRRIAEDAGVDAAGLCRQLCMGWDEIRPLAADALLTIGAHTANHVMLAKATAATVRAEMTDGAAGIEAALGIVPRHFAYPVGDPTSAGPREFAIAAELGFRSAVTTRPGVLFPDHRAHMTALPRISLNGEFQRLRYLDVLLSGAPTALMNRFRRVDAA